MPKAKKNNNNSSGSGRMYGKMISSNSNSNYSPSSSSPSASSIHNCNGSGGSGGGGTTTTPQAILIPSSTQLMAGSGHPSILKNKVGGGGGGQMSASDPLIISSIEDPYGDINLIANASANSSYIYDGGNSSNVSSQPPAKRRKQDPKTGKGLRHFSMKVCEKVKQKGSTTYNEVADELVAEFSADPIASRAAFQGGYMQEGAEPFDQKNIRRRVYDALNVLMAMNIISKEKKEIKWIGLPTNAAQECLELEQEKEKRLERIAVKKQQLRDLLLQQIAFKNLVERNSGYKSVPSRNAIINLPFIIVNTDKKTVIDCSISNDKTEYLFNFDNTFEIHDDIEVLKRMGLAFGLDKGNGEPLDKRSHEAARNILPEALRVELDEMIEENQGL